MDCGFACERVLAEKNRKKSRVSLLATKATDTWHMASWPTGRYHAGYELRSCVYVNKQ